MEHGPYEALDQRLQRLEREAAALRADLTALTWLPQPVGPAVAPAQAVPAPPPPLPVRRPPPPISSTGEAPRRGPSLEGFLAGRGLQIAGMFLVLLGVAFFLNLAFTRGWIGPAERIVLGLVAGSALIAEGARRRKPGGAVLAETFLGLGAGILYLSLWAAVAVYPQLHISRTAAFVAMIAVTGVLAALAASRRSERVALMGLAGGFLTPLLLSSDSPERTVLAAYLLVLGGGFAALGVRARFRVVEGAAFGATMLYLPAFLPDGRVWPLAAAATTVTAFFALFTTALAAGAARDAQAPPFRNVLLGLNFFFYVTMLFALFAIYFSRQTALGEAYLVIAAALLLAARIVPVRALTTTFAYLGVAAATLALPALLHQTALLDAFAVEGALLAVVGASRNDRFAATAGAVLLGVSALWVVGDAFALPPANTAFSALALSFVITIAALAFVRTQVGSLTNARNLRALATVVVHVVAIAGISRVLLDVLGGPHWDNGVPSHAQVAVSLAWTVYAAALFGIGLRRPVALLRHLGLILFGVTIFKVLALDLTNVDVTWRIASAGVLGLVCIIASAWYMRAQAPPAARETPT